jgi:hypothetical protein
VYGALLSACQSGIERRFLMESRDKQDGIRSWFQLVRQYATNVNRDVRSKRSESVIHKIFHRSYRGGIIKLIQDYEDAYTELALLGKNNWNDDEIKKHWFVHNAQNIGLADTVFGDLVSHMSFLETCDFLRSHAIRLDQQYKKKAARQIHNTSQLSNTAKKDKVKKVLALINKIQIQDSFSSDEESDTLSPTKTAMICKLAQIPPEIWMTLPLEAKKWLLNETKSQQQEDDKMKKSLALRISTAKPNEKETRNANMPNQNARLKNIAKGKGLIKDNKNQTYYFVDEFLDRVDYEYWSSNHHSHATLSISNFPHNKCMNLLYLPEIYHICILDGGADICVSGQVWEDLSIHNTRRANVVGFDH